MPPAPRWSSSLYLPLMQKPRHLPWRNWADLERGQQPVADEGRGQFFRPVGKVARGPHLLEVRVEDVLFQHAALDDDFEEFIDGGWERHQRTFAGGEAT